MMVTIRVPSVWYTDSSLPAVMTATDVVPPQNVSPEMSSCLTGLANSFRMSSPERKSIRYTTPEGNHHVKTH